MSGDSAAPAALWHRLAPARIEAAVAAALADGWLDDAAPAIVVHDLDHLRSRLDDLASAFPAGTVHAIAIKANPVVAILREVVAAGHGLEAASFEEVELAREAGCPADRIVLDSPAKTRTELRDALHLGVRLNVDNLDELARLRELGPPPEARIGLRVSPGVSPGSIAATSVGDVRSRFGVPWRDDPGPIVEAFARHPWLSGLHAHVGSQGVALEQLAFAARRLADMRRTIHDALGVARVRTVDVGGGLPTDYGHGECAPGARAWADALRAAAPSLFADDVELVTEAGRAVQVGCGFAVSRVEYVKVAGDRRLATVHLGADMFLRTAYQPTIWRHAITVLDPTGRPKAGPVAPWTIVGPLCFAGDVLTEARPLPAIDEGDLVVVHDAGGYTLGMWSSHCSRRRPPVLGLAGNPAALSMLAPRRAA